MRTGRPRLRRRTRMRDELRHLSAADPVALCVRVMERFFEEVYADPELRGVMARTHIDIDLRCIFREVLEEQLGPHTFAVALDLLPGDSVAKRLQIGGVE